MSCYFESVLQHFKILLNKRMLVILLLGFSSGVPLALVGSTLQAWMFTRNVDLTVIGIFSLVGLPYTLKFLWAPFMDRYTPPFLALKGAIGRRRSRRRGWMILCQIALITCIAGMAFCDPSQSPSVLAFLAVLVAFSSASQDIVVDAYKTELLEIPEYGLGAAVANLGYRVAMLFSGAFALILSDQLSWKSVYLVMAGSISVGLVTSLLAPEPKNPNSVPRSFDKSLKEAVVAPFVEFFTRKKAYEVLIFVVIYKLDVVFALAMMTPFMLEIGFTKTEIGVVTKGFGLAATIAGTFVGGVWLNRIGIYRSLWTFGILQGISGACFFLLARLGHNYPMMVTTIAAENFFSGMGNSAYAAFMMSLCNPKFTATQFALLTSLMALTRTLAGAPTGWFAKTFGWETYFLFSIFLALPGLLLLVRFNSWKTKLKFTPSPTHCQT